MSLLEKALSMQREQEKFAEKEAKLNAERSRVKGTDKKRKYLEQDNDDDEFEVADNVYNMTEEKLQKTKREEMFSSKSKSFEAIKPTKEENSKYGMKVGMKAEDIEKQRGTLSFN